MNFLKNVFANYLNQIYISIIGIIIGPLYLKYMGAEMYGLVGFYTLMQSLFTLLDLGLAPSIVRETARGSNFIQALLVVGLFMALLGFSIIYCLSHGIAHTWLKIQILDKNTVEFSIKLMAVSLSLRWMTTLYKSILMGSERFGLLSWCNILFTTLKFPGSLLVLRFISTNPIFFFSYHVMICCFEVMTFGYLSYKTMPELLQNLRSILLMNLWKSIKPVIPFALNIALTTAVWMLIMQSDKLVLSKLLTLSDYGYFTLGVLAASATMALSGPITTAMAPRLVKLKTENDEKGLIEFYHKASQFGAMVIIPASLVMALFAEQILWIWTGDSIATQKAAPILSFYALGNGLMGLSGFPGFLQYAFGVMKQQIVGPLIFLITFIIGMWFFTPKYGMLGVGWIWLITNALYFLLWTPYIHNYFIKKIHIDWLLKDILPILLISLSTLLIFKKLRLETESGLLQFIQIGSFGLISILLNIAYTQLPKLGIRFKKHVLSDEMI